MTQGVGLIKVEVDARDVLSSLQLSVKMRGKRRAMWRVKIAATLVALAGRVLGGDVDLTAEVR